MFLLLLDRGTVQKVIVLPKDPTTMEELTLEEVEVFRVCLCVSLDTSHQNDSTYYKLKHSFFHNLQTRVPVKTMKISSKRVSFYSTPMLQNLIHALLFSHNVTLQLQSSRCLWIQ